jgi:hypothetical protein
MKTKLYSLLTGLLMAVCVTSYGQEIVSTITSTSTSYYSGIVETPDGGFLIGSCFDLYNRGYMVYKIAPDGTYLDSIRFRGIYDLLEVPGEPDQKLLYGYDIEDNVYHLTLTVIDDNLNLISETSIPIGEYEYDFWDGFTFVAPNNEILFPYSSGTDDVFHLMRISLDGTVLEDKAFPEIPCGTWNSDYTNDSIVYYSDVNVFTESPLTYNCLGFYRNAEDTTIVVNYILDENLNILESIEYPSYNPDAIFGPELFTNVTALGTETSKEVYLSTSMRLSGTTASTIIRYDNDNHPNATRRFAGNSYPGYLVAKDKNTVYFTLAYNNTHVSLYRLDGNLDNVWYIGLPCPSNIGVSMHTTKILNNGDIIVGYNIYRSGNAFFKYHIVRDNTLDDVTETRAPETPFALYPNPVKDAVNITFAEGNEPATMAVYDLTGRMVGMKRESMESLDMSAMSAGVYMVRVTMKDGMSYNEKIIKE